MKRVENVFSISYDSHQNRDRESRCGQSLVISLFLDRYNALSGFYNRDI